MQLSETRLESFQKQFFYQQLQSQKQESEFTPDLWQELLPGHLLATGTLVIQAGKSKMSGHDAITLLPY